MGLLYSDLFTRLESCDWLGRKIIHYEQVTDVELGALYGHAWLTVFPSFVEGWSLPVAESLAHGMTCLASSSSSIPEVGGDLARYFSPYNPLELRDIVRLLVEYLEEVQEMGARIRSSYKPTGWDHCARSITTIVRDGLEQLQETTA